jgi:hypothetical protein
MEAQLRYRHHLGSDGFKSTFGGGQKVSRRPRAPEPARIQKPPAKPDIAPSGLPRLDFVQRNISRAADQKSRAKPAHVPTSKERIVDARHAPGQIPQYIEVRKAKMDSRNVVPQGDGCPPGMRLLGENEKQESILDLDEQKEEMIAKLSRLPLNIESPTLLREKKMIEAELDEIERSIDQLKKKYVFVPDD